MTLTGNIETLEGRPRTAVRALDTAVISVEDGERSPRMFNQQHRSLKKRGRGRFYT